MPVYSPVTSVAGIAAVVALVTSDRAMTAAQRAQVALYLQEAANRFTPEQIDSMLSEALKILNRDSPHEVTEEFSGNGSTYDFVLARFVDGTSSVEQVEFPAGSREPDIMDDGDWATFTFHDPDETRLRLLYDTPGVGQKVVATYTAPYTLEDLPSDLFEPVAHLAASIALQAVAAHYAETIDPTIGADVVNYRSKSSEFTALAKTQRGFYDDAMGKSVDGVIAASASKDIDVDYPGGYDRFWHPRRYR